ncbi:MAG TPA: serine hydrolase, partial [Thermoanaerobaculia bacterium]
ARREGRENTATAGELVRLLAAIHRGEACGAKCTRDTIRILALPKQSPLRRALPPSVRAASKGGSLEGIRVDAGIVFARRHPFAIAVMTSQASNENAAEETIESITRAAYEYFDRLARASRHGRLNE